MHLILTHEQADFDALASALAAKLLDPGSFAVLPRRINRNVRGFLTLYWDRLPFIEYRDIPKGSIRRITLVDSQTLPSLKSIDKDHEVRVIDHHPPTPEIDPSWTTHFDPVGATATLLVEALRERGAELGLVHSTLLLLGIYEDTGSLTYANTTARDALAVAWLLESGASLSVAADFLNQPLSSEQRQLYEVLLKNAETVKLHGLSVIIASADAGGMVDEVSTLAHKLRDMFDPAGLFLLVALDGHVQLVARSNTDSIDVSRIAERFGGGGHSRAAAALIRKRPLESIREELLEALPELIVPPKTVGEIMSRDPQLLPATTSIADAADRMQRFGHEGYPVVEGGQVVGLLTRRAVDRAMAHGLRNKHIKTIMDAGKVLVHPSDSVPHLQSVMIENAWGQVPVADPVSGEIVGIVTRTDVLKTLADRMVETRTSILSSELERALPASRLALLKLVARVAEARGAALYLVGGFVRDLLLGSSGFDFDLVVEGDAIGLARSLARSYGGKVSSHIRFGTAKWQLGLGESKLIGALEDLVREIDPATLPESLDFVAARTEFYLHPTALPSVERGSIKLDLHRRDFTINTLALRLDGRHYGQILDFWGGGQDLKAGLIRVLHSLSFVDDPTRILRAVRLEQRLSFEIEGRTLELLQDAKPLLDRVSGERIRSEFALIFEEARSLEIMDRLKELGLLKAIHVALNWDEWLRTRFRQAKAFEPPSAWKLQAAPPVELLLYAIWVARIEVGQVHEVCERLHLPGRVRQAILEAHHTRGTLLDSLARSRPSEVYRRLEGVSEPALAAAWIALEGSPEGRWAIEQYLSEWRFVHPLSDGTRLRELGLPPGPAYGRILATLRAGWIDQTITSEEEERRLLEELVQEAVGDG